MNIKTKNIKTHDILKKQSFVDIESVADKRLGCLVGEIFVPILKVLCSIHQLPSDFDSISADLGSK